MLSTTSNRAAKKAILRLHNLDLFPNHRVILTYSDNRMNEMTLRVPPRMTKHDIKDYIEQVHRLPVKGLDTVNYDRREKRWGPYRKKYFEPAFKKVHVQLKSIQKVPSSTL